MSDWHLYIIRCADNSLYTGVTIDVERRFLEHQSQGEKCAKYLKGKAPLRLAFQEMIGDKQLAYRLEWRVKRLTKGEKELLVRGSIRLADLLPTREDSTNNN